MTRASGWLLVALAVVWSCWPCRPAGAHEFRPATLSLQAHADGEVSVRFSPPSVTARGPTSGALRPVPPEHCVGLGPHRWSCGPEGLAGTLRIAGLATDPVDVLVHVRWVDGAELRTRLDPDTPSIVLPRGAVVAGPGDALGVYFALGGEHIVHGVDHLLFVLALLLLGGGVRGHLRTITAFTVGHSVALLVQSQLPGVIALPGPWVEACITASIVVAAAESLRPARGRAAAWPWALAFGVLHGLGFAGALAQLGLPPEHRLEALVGFNLGVEAGQLAVVLGLLCVAAVVRSAARERLRRGLAFAAGSVAVAWTLERIVSS